MLVLSVIILLVLALSVPALINWVRQETKDTVHVKRSSTAFHLAEAGMDQGMWKLQESQQTWEAAKAGTLVTGYNGATEYALSFKDNTTGHYRITFTPGPGAGEVTVLSKGQDPSTKEVRAIQAVFSQSGAGTFAIRTKENATFGANTEVEWGPIISKNIISTGGKGHPRFMTSSNISPNDTNGAAEPNTDGVQWWSYKTDLPPEPEIDFEFYKASATYYGTAAGSAPSGCGNGGGSSYYRVGNATFQGCNDLSGKVYYVTGECSFTTGPGTNRLKGTIICLGRVNIHGNGDGALDLIDQPVPAEAWLEYGNDWPYYVTEPGPDGDFDPLCPHATFTDAKNANYAATGVTYDIQDAFFHGFLYAGGTGFSLTGGGGSVMVGAVYSNSDTTIATSGFTIYYDPVVAEEIKTTNVIITRESWKEIAGLSWP
jgi:hypothetical protein